MQIPHGVRIIGKGAFKNHTHIRRVILPDTLKTIHEDAFFNCAQLEEIVFPQGLKSIKKGAFHHCRSLKTLRFPKSLQELDEEAFAWCDEISEVVFEEGCSLEMHNPPFQKHPKLRLISIPPSVKILNQGTLGYNANTVIQCYAGSDAYFTAKILNIPYLLPDGKEYDSTADFVIENGTVTKYLGTHPLVIIPEGTAAIGCDAFRGLEHITHVFFPDSVVTIGDGAFANCINLSVVRLPKHLKCIPKDAFYQCGWLLSINFPQGLATIESGAFFGASLREVHLPHGLGSIREQAFGNCHILRDIHIPESVYLLENIVSGSPSVTIVAPEGSKASQYAREHGIPLRNVITPPEPPRSEDLPGNIRRTFYETLEPRKQLLYSALVTALLRMDDVCRTEGFSADPLDVLGVVWAVAYDYPEIFWVNWNRLQIFGSALFKPGKLGTVYSVTKQQRDQIQNQIDQLVTPFLSNIPRNLSEYERAKRAYIWVADQLEYDQEGSKQDDKHLYRSITHDDLRNIYGAFLKKKVVCGGYARALQYILQRMGIECVEYCGGDSQEHHAWVCARLEGDFYHIDITWDDNDCLDYKYFCLTDDEMYKHQHHFDYLANEIRCSATRCSYFAMEGLYFHHVDEDDIVEGIRGFLSKYPKNRVFVKFADLLLLHRAYACMRGSKKLKDLVRKTSFSAPVVTADDDNLLLDILF